MREDKNEQAIKKAIAVLAKVACDGETLGYRDGPAPSIEVRSEALRSLASYVPHPDAIEVLTKILGDDWYGLELRQVAAAALRNR
jgi:hypothetical protein